jgi:hypothetical protein
MKGARLTRFAALALLAGACLAAPALAEEQADSGAPHNKPPRIQIALLLDTSNSMDGLINQARAQLWKIVNEFATAKKDGQLPEIEVALYEYGKQSLPREQHFLRQVVPLSDDLDKISSELFALTTNGGEEYCGAVIDAALKQLKWSTSDEDFKAIFVCGNEPFTQGPIDPYKAVEEAIRRGIVVNTIFCGPFQEGVNTGWQKGSQLADGSYINIDQNAAVVAIETPFDKQLAQLSNELNRTYVFYGSEQLRQERRALQRQQDEKAAAAAPTAAADRALAKAGRAYNLSAFDLIDGLKRNAVKLEELKDEDLPEEIRKLPAEERKAYLDKLAAERERLQQEIRKLAAEREKFIAIEQEKVAGQQAKTLQSAVIEAVRKQAAQKRFSFDEK